MATSVEEDFESHEANNLSLNDCINVEDGLKLARDHVEELYRFKDCYFLEHGIEAASEKEEKLQQKLNEVLEVINAIKYKCDVLPRAQLLYLKGRALNVISQYDPVAEEVLSKAVKLNPHLVMAWNELGECYWNKGDMQAAYNCFVGALDMERNKVSLRGMSMVLRQLGANAEQKLKSIEESVSMAKEAVQMDVKDGTSWCTLGTAYFSLFFASNQDPAILAQCMKAYSQAENDIVAQYHSDLHYNRAVVYQYEENYKLAIMGYTRASELDPLWEDPKQKLAELIEYLVKVCEFVKTKGQVKAKKLHQMISCINPVRDLGPYSGGKYTSQSGKTVKLQYTSFKNLSEGINHEMVVLGKVVCALGDSMPFTFCFIDSESTCLAVTLYNLAAGQGVIIGDAVAIPEPYMEHVDLEHEGNVISFWSIRVANPLVLVVNKRKFTRDKIANSSFSVRSLLQ